MREDFLHFIWQHQYYHLANVKTESGVSIQVIKQGNHNFDAGPDFEQAKIIIGKVEWNGDVEIHVKTSDWARHNHHKDKAYNKVVLHVVWQNDQLVSREDGTEMPTLVLKPLVDILLEEKCDLLVNNMEAISCASQLDSVPVIIKHEVIQRSLVKRLERKAEVVLKELDAVRGDWDEVAYRIFMRQMGMKVNGESFYELAKLVPYKLIRAHKKYIFKLEALLFGVGGFLKREIKEDYANLLRKEYQFLRHKFKIKNELPPEMWKFMRLRPANFPSLRLAQAASMLSNTSTLFILFIEASTSIKPLFNTSEYWRSHYRFGNAAAKKVPNLGKQSSDLLIINVIAPLLMAYGISLNEQEYRMKALQVLESVSAEKNRIITAWQNLGVAVSNSGESQGLIELYNESCANKRCLNCGIGFSILKQK